MSFKSLVNKLMKEGKSKAAATKIAGSVANAKMKGAGSGPTAKQKARAKSPAKKKDKGSKTYVVSGSRSSKEGKTTKVYRKDGSIKSERNIKDSGTKKETRYSAFFH